MEDVLDLYETQHNPENPVVCVDEKPYQLLDDKIKPIAMKKGKAKKFDYEYKREGTCNIFMISQPFDGFRYCKVTKRRAVEL